MVSKLSLRTVILCAVFVAFSGLVVGLHILMTRIQLRESSLIEQDLGRKDIERITLALRGELTSLATHQVEWSVWDEAYRFTKGENETFAETYLNYDGLLITADQFIFARTDGEIITTGRLDEDKKEIVEVSPILLASFAATDSFKSFERAPSDTEFVYTPKKGLIVLEDGPYYLSASYVVDNVDREAPPSGIVLFAKRLSAGTFAKIREQTKLPLAYLHSGQEEFVVKTLGFSGERVSEDLRIEVRLVDDQVQARAVLLDIHGKPGLFVETYVPERIFQRSMATTHTVLFWVTIFACATLLILYATLRVFLIAPVSSMYHELSQLSDSASASGRITQQRGRELGAISVGINQALESLERKERALVVARGEAERANAAKSVFVAKVSHELRTPLNSIIGMLRILLKEEASSARRGYIRMASEGASSLLATINEILDFSKIESGSLTLERIEFDTRDVVRQAIRTVAPRLDERPDVELTVTMSPDIPASVYGDPTRLGQVLVNLLGNALKFTKRGFVRVAVSCDSEMWAFEIRDSGVGIPPDRLDSIFHPFTQADESVTRTFQGTGLGLTIVRQIVEEMGGRVWVESQVGKGSTFFVRLPLEGASPSPRSGPLDRPLRKTLVLSNSQQLREDLSSAFRAGGFSVTQGDAREGRVGSGLDAFSDSKCLIVATTEVAALPWFVEAVNRIASTKDRARVILLLKPSELALRERYSMWHGLCMLAQPAIAEDVVDAALGLYSESEEILNDTAEIPKAARRLRVLVADDAYTNRLILTSALSEAGHDVVGVENGYELISELVKNSERGAPFRFDVILTDVQMPELDGVEATRQIRARESEGLLTARTPIIAVTANAFKEEMERIKSHGVDAVVTKPVDPVELLAVMTHLVDGDPTNITGRFKRAPSVTDPAIQSVMEEFLNSVKASAKNTEIASTELLRGIINLDEVFERSGRSLRRTRLILDAFCEGVNPQLEALCRFAASNDRERVKGAAHAVKGLLLDVGARAAAQKAGVVEHQALDLSTEELVSLSSDIASQGSDVRDSAVALSRLLGERITSQQGVTQANSPRK